MKTAPFPAAPRLSFLLLAVVLSGLILAPRGWGAAPGMPPGFKTQTISTPAGADIHVRSGGSGPGVPGPRVGAETAIAASAGRCNIPAVTAGRGSGGLNGGAMTTTGRAFPQLAVAVAGRGLYR